MRKKRIVATALALSMLTSPMGMYRAAAAEPDASHSDLEVTVVPLGDTGEADPAEQTHDAEPSAAEPAAPAEESPDTGEEAPEEGTSSPDEPGIERPEQSDTVETLPGSAEDNMEHIKGEDKADSGEAESPDKPETSEETGTDSGSEKAEGTGESSEGKDAETDKPADEQEPEKKDYSCIYDPDTGHFKITFNITADAEGDQTVELSKVMEEINASGKQSFDEWFSGDGAETLTSAKENHKSTIRQTFNGVEYIYNVEDGTVQLYEEPGCTTVFDVSMANGSKHTYVYKNNSLTVATPDMKNDDKTGVIGFDGQELPDDYAKGFLSPKYNLEDPDADGVLETIIDKALETSESRRQYYVDQNGNLTTTYTKPRIEKGTPVEEINGKYYVYSEAGDCYYGAFNSNQVMPDPNRPGQYVVKNTTSSKVSEAIKADGSKYYAPWVRGSSIDATRPSASQIQDSLNRYLTENNTTLSDEILKYYNSKDGTNYTTIEELLANNPEAEKELTSRAGADTTLNPLLIHSSEQYDNFYQNILSFNVGSKEDMDKFLGDDSIDHGHGHGSWASDGREMTIGDYMVGKLNETPGAWETANKYFQSLRLSGMSAEEATWAAFTMAVNIDGPRADNNYQDTAWNWYASMVLHQADGTLHLTKTDEKGQIIGDDEGEGQTSFYLWTYDDETNEPLYCTYVEPTYTTNSDGEQVLETEGFYCWVKYDPEQDKMNYTITTTNGSLNIDYALLEDMVYYLQEAVAPEGYDADPNVYVICDQDTYQKLAESGAFDSVENPAEGTSAPVAGWLGAIKGGETLTINFVNTASEPDPDPEPDPVPPPVIPPVDPQTPDVPVDPETPVLPPVQEETPEAPVLSQTPEPAPVQDTRTDILPQTGTTFWLAGMLMSFGTALLGGGWFFTRRQHAEK